MSAAKMKTSTFQHRYNSNREIDSKYLKNKWRGLDHGMSKDSQYLLEQKCSKMILDCVDWRVLGEGTDM